MLCFLIDDDPEDQEIFMLALSDLNQEIQCVTACDCSAALQKLQEEDFNPHYIFLDLNMPKINGTACLVEIKKIARLHHIPVIIYTTSSEHKDILETRQLGAAGFITKPTSVTTLVRKLEEVFKD